MNPESKKGKNQLFSDLFVRHSGKGNPLFSDLFAQKDGKHQPLFSDLFEKQSRKQEPLFNDLFQKVQPQNRYGEKTELKQVVLPTKQHYVLIGIGDSIVSGKGTVKGSYVEKYGTILNRKGKRKIEVHNFGKNGYTSSQVLTVLRNERVKIGVKKADIIFLNLGGNDIVNGVAEQGISLKLFQTIQHIRHQFYEKLTEVFIAIRKLNEKAIIVVNTLYNPIRSKGMMNGFIQNYLDKWNSGLVKIALQYDPVVVVPIHRSLTVESEEKWLSADHYHLNDYGAEVVAKEIEKRIILKVN